jgi:hypothetical protein
MIKIRQNRSEQISERFFCIIPQNDHFKIIKKGVKTNMGGGNAKQVISYRLLAIALYHLAS